ncbi:MAG TPA: TIM barrel protein [Spirochaetia bacterium]|nr:TIM barrel protein [Spirochaetia bacterium]
MTDARKSENPPPRRHGFGLSVYGVLYLTGRVAAGTPLANPRPLDAKGFLKLAIESRLSVVEVSTSFVSARSDVSELRAFRDAAENGGLRTVIAGPLVLDTDAVAAEIAVCKEIGATVLRCTMSRLLCGDRAPLGGYDGWKEHVAAVVASIRKNLRAAEKAGVTLAIENHQDADSDTLEEICRTFNSASVGVTLDAGNPLAVGEDPLEFAGRLLPYIADVHLKDYRMITTAEGYRLVHCAIGDGVVDFPGLWQLLASKPHVPRSIEMAALNARHIKLLTPEWWEGYGRRDVRSLVPVVRLWQRRGEPEAGAPEWRTPIELGDITGAETWERERLARSIENLSRIEGAPYGTKA